MLKFDHELMTVEELIKLLSEFPKDTVVFVEGDKCPSCTIKIEAFPGVVLIMATS